MTSAVLHNARSADKQHACAIAGDVDAHVTNPAARRPLTRGEKRLLGWLERFDFTGKGCYPTRAELAERCGYREEYVSALVKGLREKGYITVTKRRRPGAQYAHNVYRVRDWSPNVRRGVCNLRRDFVARRAAAEAGHFSGSYLERTATASRAHTPLVNPSFGAVVDQSCGRARRDFGFRRTSMQAHGGQRRFAVPSLTCLTCQELAQELDTARSLLRAQAVETSKVVEELSNAHSALGAAGKEIRTLKGRLTREANESAKADQIEAVADHWRKHRPKAHPSFGKAGSKSYGIIEKALGLMAEDEAGAVGACKEAIDGLHMAPWQRYDKRYARKVDDKTVLRNSVEHALGDESRIERCRGIVRWAQADGADRAFDMWQVASQVEQACMRVWYEEYRHRQDPPEPPYDSLSFLVDGIVTRGDGR